MLEITVHEIRGKCLVYKTGDKIMIDDPEIVPEEMNSLCTYTLSALPHHA